LPKEFLSSIYEINTNWLQERQLQGLIVDLDNTMLGRAEEKANERLKLWVKQISASIPIIILSNNWSVRVKNIAAELGLEVIAPAAKPFSWAFKQALAKLKTEPEKTALVGDQLFTDILGGNFLRLYTVLVPPASDVDLLHTKILRRLEKLILRNHFTN
jgi:HAD superfamily phosphatase (TIGR01668 family)